MQNIKGFFNLENKCSSSLHRWLFRLFLYLHFYAKMYRPPICALELETMRMLFLQNKIHANTWRQPTRSEKLTYKVGSYEQRGDSQVVCRIQAPWKAILNRSTWKPLSHTKLFAYNGSHTIAAIFFIPEQKPERRDLCWCGENYLNHVLSRSTQMVCYVKTAIMLINLKWKPCGGHNVYTSLNMTGSVRVNEQWGEKRKKGEFNVTKHPKNVQPTKSLGMNYSHMRKGFWASGLKIRERRRLTHIHAGFT